MGLFSCKVCEEKDKRIADLKEMVSRMSQLSIPDNNILPLVHLEADAVLGARQEVINMDDDDGANESEAARMMSGTY
jgi:hypothetical protein